MQVNGQPELSISSNRSTRCAVWMASAVPERAIVGWHEAPESLRGLLHVVASGPAHEVRKAVAGGSPAVTPSPGTRPEVRRWRWTAQGLTVGTGVPVPPRPHRRELQRRCGARGAVTIRRVSSQAQAADAREFLLRRYRQAAVSPDHALRVGGLVADAEPEPRLIATGLLHDILEDTHTRLDELERRFDARVVARVRLLADPGGRRSYQARKRLLREQVAHADWGTALVFAADTLDRLRTLQHDPTPLAPQQRAHYQAAVGLVTTRLPPLPWNHELTRLTAAVLHAR